MARDPDEQKSGKVSGRWTVSFSLGLLALLGMVVLYGLFRDPAIATLRSRTGSQERILAVTFGMSHRWQRGSAAAVLWERVRPAENAALKPGRVLWATNTSSMVVWPEAPPPKGFRYEHLLRDDDGCVFEPGEGTYVPFSPMTFLRSRPPPEETHASVFFSFPRSGKLFIGDRDVNADPIWSEIRNPAPLGSPRFAAGPLPQAGVNGPLEVEVRSVTHQAWGSTSSFVDYKLRERGLETDRWRLARYFAEDASGNRRGEQKSFSGPLNSLKVTNLCRKEAWRLHLDMLPVDFRQTPPDAVFTLPAAPYPVRGETTPYAAEGKAGDSYVYVRRMGWTSGKNASTPGTPAVYIELRQMSGILLALLETSEGPLSTPLAANRIADWQNDPQTSRPGAAARAWIVRHPVGEYPFALPQEWHGRKDLRLKLYYPRSVDVAFQPY